MNIELQSYKLAQIYSTKSSLPSSHFRTHKADNMEKDVDTKTQAAVIDTTNVPAPIVVKFEMPKDVEKQKNDKSRVEVDDATKKTTKSSLCQLLPVVLFLVTFATVLSLLIIYMDPSSEF